MAHTLDLKRLEEVFDVVNEHRDDLSEWETNFLDSVYDQWERQVQLSEKQLEKLEQIYVKV